MEWTLDRKRPISPQICEQLCVKISSGQFPAGCRLPSVRDIALSAGVNPNTVQKSLEALATQGILYSERGSGWYVSENRAAATTVANDVVKTKTQEYFTALKALGMSDDQIKKYVEEWNE